MCAAECTDIGGPDNTCGLVGFEHRGDLCFCKYDTMELPETPDGWDLASAGNFGNGTGPVDSTGTCVKEIDDPQPVCYKYTDPEDICCYNSTQPEGGVPTPTPTGGQDDTVGTGHRNWGLSSSVDAKEVGSNDMEGGYERTETHKKCHNNGRCCRDIMMRYDGHGNLVQKSKGRPYGEACENVS